MAVSPLPVHGVDISHHQSGTLDFAGAKRRGLKWVYHKATEGTSLKDSRYAQRRAEVAKAGLPFGAYHFARADRGDAAEEAKFFLDVAQPKPGDLRPALDLETMEGLSLAEIRVWARTFIDYVEKRIGVKPVVYTPFDLGSVDDGCVIWRPRYNNSNTPPTLPWDVFQFSNGVYGVPNRVRGIGNVDLNYMRPGLEVSDLLIPEPRPEPKPEPVVQRLHLMHASMQYSDSRRQMHSDAHAIFARAEKRGVAWITGTEAGGDQLREVLRTAAGEHGYRFFIRNRNDSWIAVRRDLIKGNVEVEYKPLIFTGDGIGHHGPRGVLAVSFDSLPGLGRITVLATHYLTKGRPGAKSALYRTNVPFNKKLAVETGRLAREHGKGSALVFFGGDQNIVDRDEDTFMGEPLTSSWDELKRYENTGHGNIDVIASYDRDGRVKAAYVRALDDKEFPLNTDHFVVESGYDVRLLGA